MSNTDFIFHIAELIAALAGSYFYLKTSNKLIKPFVWYLWTVVIVETFGMYGFFLLNNYDNEIAKLTANVVRRFLDPEPFEYPG